MPDTPFINHSDFSGYELRNWRVQTVAGLPTADSSNARMIRWDSTTGKLRISDGSAWKLEATDSLLFNGQNAAYYLDRVNHTGQQTASTISDFHTAVRTNRLDQMAAPTASVAFGSQKITGLADGTGANDAVTKQQLDAVAASAASGVSIKAAVRFATVANDTLSGLAARNGVTPVAGDRVLVTAQTTASANGIYVAASGAWARSTDADTNGELAPGTAVYVNEGTSGGDKLWALATDTAVTIGTTSQTWTQISGTGTSYTAGDGLALTGSAFSVVAATNGGLSVSGSGVALATSGNVRGVRANVSQVPAPSSGSLATVTHNLNTQNIANVQLIRNSDNVGIGAVYWQANGVNTVLVDVGDPALATDIYRAIVSAA